MDKTLDNIACIIDTYEGGEWKSADSLRGLLRDLSAAYYHLTKFNIEAFQKYNSIQHNHLGSVASGIIYAEKKCPELRISRKILVSVSKVLDAIRSEIGILRSGN